MSKVGPTFKGGVLLFAVVFVLGAAGMYGGAQLVDEEKVAAADGGGGVPGGPVNVTVLGQNILFSPRNIVASPGAQVTVIFDNRDAGVQHNIHFFANRGRTATLARSEIITGPAVDPPLTFTAPTAAGNYPFICDVHPDTMTGTLTVRE
jgi:plastocyanin